MGKRKSPNKAPDREKKWDKVFNALLKLCQNLQKDRQFLEDKLKSLHGAMYKMKMEQKVESFKAEFMLGLKDREAFIYKRRYEHADNELADFREMLEYLSQKCPEPKVISDNVINTREGSRNKALLGEVRKLKTEIEKLKSEKNSDISALLAEKNFAWNQLKIRESNLTEQLRKKSDEIQHANEKVVALVNRAEELEISNVKLRSDFTKIESESSQKSEEISGLRKEIELLKSRSGSATPILRPHRGNKDSTIGARVIAMKKESDPSQTVEKVSRIKRTARKSTGGKGSKKQFMITESNSSKRKLADDTPKLFTSSFKVPKLKSSSSPQIIDLT